MKYLLHLVTDYKSLRPDPILIAVCGSLVQAHSIVSHPGSVSCLDWQGVKTWEGLDDCEDLIGFDENGVSAWLILRANTGVLIEDFPALDQLYEYETD